MPMKRYILTLSVFAVMAVSTITAGAASAFMSPYDPWTIEAPTPAASVESITFDEVTIKTDGRKVHVSGAEEQTLEVFNIAGVKVASYVIDSSEKTINLTVPRGIYILRVGKVARKVNIL